MATVFSIITRDDIIHLRKQLGYSQRIFGIELARLNGNKNPYTRGYISNLENGNQEISDDVLQALLNMVNLISRFEYFPFIDGNIKYHKSQVKSGALYGGISKLCKWTDCDFHFIPTAPNQMQCPGCRHRRRKK